MIWCNPVLLRISHLLQHPLETKGLRKELLKDLQPTNL
uniref:Uncharacterized protein n=1 Tax=Arundo donax TaxID=35708 RepID=A0A0A8YFI7_ARUDO